MSGFSFGDRQVLTHIVEQHAEEAAFLWTLRDAAADAPHYRRHHLARLDERVEAHLDGLRVAGDIGWRIAMEQLDRRCDKGELFAAGVLALESGDMHRIEPLVAMAAAAEPEIRRGFAGAIAWCPPDILAATVRHWDRSADGFQRYLVLCACSAHRAAAGGKLASRLEDKETLVRARALRLAGELARTDLLDACLARLDGDDIEERFWASWSAVLLGDRNAALAALDRFCRDDTRRAWAALELSVRCRNVIDGAEMLRRLSGDPAHRHRLVVGLGHLGDPVVVPWLIERMDDPAMARIAGASFVLISGADLAVNDLDQDAVEAEQEDDPDAHLPWPSREKVRAWWVSHGDRLPSGRRFLLGQEIGTAGCEHAWRNGTQPQRRAAGHEIALAGKGALRNWRARVARPAG